VKEVREISVFFNQWNVNKDGEKAKGFIHFRKNLLEPLSFIGIAFYLSARTLSIIC
jgi:hypothetical protein